MMNEPIFVDDIPGFEGNYGISENGLVYSYVRRRFIKSHNNIRVYLMVSLCRDGKVTKKYIHRILAEIYIPNPNNLKCVDHIDRNKLNNELSNLRWCSHTENNQNRTKAKGKSSKYKGVYWYKQGSKWVVQIKINYKTINLGQYNDERDAALAYNNAATKYFGDFANLNIIE